MHIHQVKYITHNSAGKNMKQVQLAYLVLQIDNIIMFSHSLISVGRGENVHMYR